MFNIGNIASIDDNIKSAGSILTAITERQRMVSNNLANASTPGYTAQKTSFADLLGSMDSPFETPLSRKMGSVRPMETSTGEPVSLQKELMDMQKNLLFYNMTTRRLTTVITGLKTASQIGR